MLGVPLPIESWKNKSSSPAWVSVQWLSMAPEWHSPLSGLPVSLEKSSSTMRLCAGSTLAPSPLPSSSQSLPVSDFGPFLAHSASFRPDQPKRLSPLATHFHKTDALGCSEITATACDTHPLHILFELQLHGGL